MLSIRTIARSAPRALNRMTAATTLRQTARPSTLLKPAVASAINAARPAAFSTTVGRRAAESEHDAELSAKLSSEIQIEEDIKASEQEPSSIKDFLANSPYDLIDEPGSELVKMTRKYNDELITISFSTADLNDVDPFDQDEALADEDAMEDDYQSPDGKKSQNAAEQDQLNEEEDMDDYDASPAINLSITVEKPGKSSGALSIEAVAHHGAIAVTQLFYFADAALARAETPDALAKRAETYAGPPFGNLDEDLQVLMERFLEDRGVSQALAVFAPDYVDVKEQRDYVQWLGNLKTFVDA